MRCYPEYKESDAEFIGEIPKDWNTMRCAHLFEVKHIKKTSGEINLSVYRDYGVIKRDSRDDNYNRVSEDTSNYKLVEPGDFVFNKMKCWQGSLGVSEYRGIVSPSYTVCEPKRHFHGKYFHYLLRSQPYIQEFNRLSYGVRIGQWELRFEDLKDIVIPYPPLSEQTQIANFLDRKTRQIDELIHTKERRIELLQEQRTVLINQAVTKGLDPTVEMKPSGVEWIGEIPKHWTITRLKYLGESIIGLSYKPEDVTDDKNGTLVLRASNIQNGKPSFLDNVYVNAEVDEKLYLKEDDILICSRSGSRELIGKNITITKELEGVTFGVFMTIFRTKFFRFISCFLNSQVFKNQSGLFLTSTINQLTINTLNNFLISFPTDEREQAQIANFLDRKTEQIDELIATEGQKIELLKEYRQSLISEAVTGKIDIRNEV